MLLYRLLSLAALAAYAPYALLRSLLGRRRIGNWRGRLGRQPYPDLANGIWIHGVSVGEVGVARTLAAELARRRPDLRVGLSATTAAGLELAEKAAGPLGIPTFPFPFDLAGPVERALEATRPGLVLLTETELWPLFLERAGRRGVAVALVNGRLSERSYRRYRLVAGPFSRILAGVRLFAMQTERDAGLVLSLGAAPERVSVTGNLKYDLPEAPPFADGERLRAASSGRPVIVAASTAEGEENSVVEAWLLVPEKERPYLAIAPRRPERFDSVAALLETRGLAVLRRSRPDGTATGRSAYLLDTIGELPSLYREATVAFVGGSLAPVGGHNPIEAWAAGAPVLVGPHTHNFREIVADGLRAGILETVAGPAELAAAVQRLLGDPEELARRSRRARDVVQAGRGAVTRTADLVLPLLSSPPRASRLTSHGPAGS